MAASVNLISTYGAKAAEKIHAQASVSTLSSMTPVELVQMQASKSARRGQTLL